MTLNMGRMRQRGNAWWREFLVMRALAFLMGAAALSLGACGDSATKDGKGSVAASSEPVKRQPGSWSTKVEIVKLDGPEVKGGEKEQLQAMMNMMGNVSICLTPEAVAAEDMSKNLEQMGSQGGECTFEDREISGNSIKFAATCKSSDGGTAKMTANGTNSATAQDFTISTVAVKADGKPAGEMVMRITGQRTGDCKPGDITPPTAPKAAGTTKS
jgi:Protein of unknown function (DUF3617)